MEMAMEENWEGKLLSNVPFNDFSRDTRLKQITYMIDQKAQY